MKYVKVMNEYSIGWPLYNESGPVERGDLPISDHLRGRLEGWARTFRDHFDPFDGWDDETLKEPYRVEAAELRDLVAAELGPEFSVELKLWEV